MFVMIIPAHFDGSYDQIQVRGVIDQKTDETAAREKLDIISMEVCIGAYHQRRVPDTDPEDGRFQKLLRLCSIIMSALTGRATRTVFLITAFRSVQGLLPSATQLTQ